MNAAPITAFAIAAFFALLPATSVGGALALPLFICAAGLACLRPSIARQVFENRPLWLLFLILLLAWAAVTLTWTTYPASEQAPKLAGLLVLGLIFAGAASTESRRLLTRSGGLAAFIVLVALLAIEAAWNLPINRAAQPDKPMGDLMQNVSRGSTVLLAMSWPVAAALFSQGGGVRIGAGVLVLGAASFWGAPFEVLALVPAFGLGLAAFALALIAPRLVVLVITGGLAAWMLAAPFVTPLIFANQHMIDALPLSSAARVAIWDYVCARIMEAPWLGHGLDASRAVTDRLQVRDLDMAAVSLHPHSGSLQIWFETGAAGAVLAAGALLAGGWAAARGAQHDRWRAAATAGVLASLGFLANVSFGIWQEWWLATMILAGALVAAIGDTRPTGRVS